MKICPQCDVPYADDDIFCLADGNALRADAGEQETVVNRRIRYEPTLASSAATEYCPTCGNENRAHSAYCKKCGKTVNQAESHPARVFGANDFTGAGSNHTVIFEPPPSYAPSSSRHTPPSPSRHLIFAVAAALVVILIGGAYFLSSSPSVADRSSNTLINNPLNFGRGLRRNAFRFQYFQPPVRHRAVWRSCEL